MKHEVVSGELYNNEVWRFDLGLKTPYQFTAENDSIDIEGLQKEWLNLSCFLVLEKMRIPLSVSPYIIVMKMIPFMR